MALKLKSFILILILSLLAIALSGTAFYLLWLKPYYENLRVDAECRILSISGGMTFYYDRYNAWPQSIKQMFDTVGQESCDSAAVLPDPYTGSIAETNLYNGKGGWVYSPKKQILRLNYRPWLPPYKFVVHLDVPPKTEPEENPEPQMK